MWFALLWKQPIWITNEQEKKKGREVCANLAGSPTVDHDSIDLSNLTE